MSWQTYKAMKPDAMSQNIVSNMGLEQSVVKQSKIKVLDLLQCVATPRWQQKLSHLL